MKKIFLIFVLITVNCFSQNIYPPISNPHPRLNIPPARFQWIGNNLTQVNVASIYNQFRYNYDNYWITTPGFILTGNDSTQWSYTFRFLTESEWSYRNDMVYTAVYTAFLWKIKNEQVSIKRLRFIIDKFIYSVDTMNFNNLPASDREPNYREYGYLGSTLIDWCYFDLSDSIKIKLSQSVFKINQNFMKDLIWTSAGNSYVSSHNAFNSVLTLHNTLALHGNIGISSAQQDSITRWYHLLFDKWMQNFLPIYSYYRTPAGGWNWGSAYSFWSLIDQYLVFEDILNSTNYNLYQQQGWVLNSINQYLYMSNPNWKCIHLGDGETSVNADMVILRHSAIFQDSRSKWLLQNFSAQQYFTGTNIYFNHLAYRDFTLPQVQSPQAPLNWWSAPVGLSVSRTGWDANSVLVWFFNSPSKKASHEHRDNNTFEIIYKSPLIVDAGYYDSYGSSHFKNYYTRTVAHNCVTVFNPNDIYYHGSEIVSNDGGQIFSNPMMNYFDIFNLNFQRGRWLTFSANDNFSYSAADASLSYSNNKVSRYYRRILHLKPKTIIVLDNILITDTTNREVRFNLHFQQTPVINGQLLEVVVPNHIDITKPNSIYSYNGVGNISVKTLEPDSLRARRIGGSGYEFYVNGINYPPLSVPDSNYYTTGRWRVELYSLFKNLSNTFLNVITVGDNYVSSSPIGQKIKNENSIGVDLDSVICLFNINGDTMSLRHKVTNLPGNRTINILGFDLKRSSTFKLFVDNNFVQSFISDTSGIVNFNIVLSNGFHNIEIIKDSTTNINNQLISVDNRYFLNIAKPSVFNSMTTLEFGIGKDNFTSLKIYDVTGKVVANVFNGFMNKGTFKIIFDASKYGLSSGVFFVVIQSGEFSAANKILLVK